MRVLILALAFSVAGLAQDATTLLNLLNLINHPPTTFLALTASQGDGSTITLSKIPGPTIQVSVVASGMSDSVLTGQAMTNGYVLAAGDAACILRANTGTAAMVAAGAWPPIPVSGIAWQCSTQIRTSGSVSGQTPIVTGSISWP